MLRIFIEHTHTSESLQIFTSIISKSFRERHRRIARIGIILTHFDELHRAWLYVRISARSLLSNMWTNLTAFSHVRITLIGICSQTFWWASQSMLTGYNVSDGIFLKHFNKLHRAHSHVRIASMSIILKHFAEPHGPWPHVSKDFVFRNNGLLPGEWL